MKKIAPVFILTAGILWGCLGCFVRELNACGLYAMEIVSLRAIVTAVFMGVFLAIYNRRLLIIRLRDLWCFLGTGICSIVFFNFCYFKAIAMTSLSVAAVLLYTAPAFVMILSYLLFQEKFTRKKILSLFLTFAGCALVTGVITDPGNTTGVGILTGLGAGIGYALYSIFGRYALEKGYHAMTITFYTFLVAALGTLFLADLPQVCMTVTESSGILGLSIALGIVCTVLPYLTYTLGLQYVDNSRASIIASVEPVTATVLGFLLFDEEITAFGMLGVALVITALFFTGERKE